MVILSFVALLSLLCIAGTMTYELEWSLIASNVCYGAKGDSFGEFKFPIDAFLVALKLVHKEGFITCRVDAGKSNWSCRVDNRDDYITTLITDDKNDIIFPTDVSMNAHASYKYPGYRGSDEILVFRNHCNPIYARRNQTARVWYGEDLMKVTDHDNEGRHCVDVYAMFE